MAVAGEQILTRLGFEVDGISLKSSLEKAAAFGSALRRAFADASAAFVGVAKGEAEVAAQADALGVSVERFAEWRFIAEQTGASADALEASLKAMLANNPGLSDAASELERAGGAMREMGDAQREAYARGLGIDPSLIPMLTRDVSGLRDMFRSLYATAGTDAAKAAEDGKGFLDGMARLAGLCDLLAKTVALSLLGTARSGIEALGDAFVAHFDDIRRVLELVVALASAAAPVIGAALGLLVSWGGQLAGLLGTLDADLVAGIGKGIAAFIALRGAVGAAIIGFANLKEAWALLTAAFSATPSLLAIGAAVTLAVVVMDNWGAVKAFLLGVWDAVASGVRAAVDAVASAFDNAVNFVTGAGSAIAGAVGSLKGPLHGGANAKVMEMFRYIKENVDPHDDGSIKDYLNKLLDGQAGDRSGKIYGLGHAVYTMSDPRAVLLKKYAQRMAELKGYADDFALLQKVEELGLPMVMERKHSDTPMCANVDMYSGLVYAMLGIPEEVFTPLFASARIAGWCANRIEEVVTCHRIMRPAYRAVTTHEAYIPMDQRGEHLHLSAAD